MTLPVLIRPYHQQLGNPVQSILKHVFYLIKAFVGMRETFLRFSSTLDQDCSNYIGPDQLIRQNSLLEGNKMALRDKSTTTNHAAIIFL